jgi:hypothetical protein
MSLYDPMFSRAERDDSDLDAARKLFSAAGRPYLRSPWSWFAWAALLPLAALLTPFAASRGVVAVLGLWSAVVVVGGLIELLAILGRREASTGLAAWVLRGQGNLSLVATALSVLLVVVDRAWALPAVWLLLLGHSLAFVGGLASAALRRAGAVYQIAGFLALAPPLKPLWLLAGATLLGNAIVGWALWRGRSNDAASASR